MEGDKGGIFCKAPGWRSLFLLKIKMEQTSGCQIRNIMQSSSTFVRILGPIPEVKKICIDQWLGKYYWILGRIWAKRGVCEQVKVVPNTVGGLGGGRTPEHFWNS